MTVELPNSTARTDLASLTETRIMQGLAGLLTRGEDVTFRTLAESAGVPERTLYRYYASKEALLSAFWLWLNNRLGMPAPARSPDELVSNIAKIFAAFAAGEPLVRAMLHDPHGRATRLAQRDVRRQRLREALQPVLEPLDAVTRKRLLVATHALISASGWETMQDYGRVTSAEAADAAQWAVTALIAQASTSRRPTKSTVKRRKK
jgi:AcrR family transcriptional regulator